MSDINRRRAILEEFGTQYTTHGLPGVTHMIAGHNGHAMTDEIIRLRDENATLRAEIDRLREQLASVQSEVEALTAERESLSSHLWDGMNEQERWKARAERAERILAALRGPSKEVWGAALEAYNHAPFTTHTPRLIRALISAVTAAEQEVGRE